MLAAFDTDGTGRRLESSLMCAATAHVLGEHFACAPHRHAAAPSTVLSQHLLTTCEGCVHAATRAVADVHANITTLEHGASPAAANAMLNLASLYTSVTVTALHAHTPRVWPPHRQAPAHHVPTWGTCGARGLTWFERVRDGSASCVANGATVHVVGHCYDFFWCHLMRERPSAWYDLLPHLQAVAGIAAATATAAAAPRQAATATMAAELLALRPEAIHVALHLRTVKRRRLKNAYYGALVVALQRRHTRHLAAIATASSALSLSAATGPSATKPELQIWIHTDHDLPLSTNGSACAGLLCGLARTAGVRIVMPGMLGAGRAAADAPVLVMRQLAAMDLLVPAVSSLSIVPALLSNTSVLFPGNSTCTNRVSLPHWHALPCNGDVIEVERVIGAMLWPPPRVAARFERASAHARLRRLQGSPSAPPAG